MAQLKWITWAFGSLVACGSASPPPVAPAPASPAAVTSPEKAAVVAPTGSVPVASAKAAESEPYDDPEEAADPATLTPLVAKEDKPSFPTRNIGDHECWQTLSLSGDAAKDYRTLIDHCGAATGSIEYAKPAKGRLDHLRDKRDTFILPIRKGLCYRFFGVADATIPDLDILIERDGALLGSDKTSGPVAIIDSDKPWCMDRDGQFEFHVQVHGEGHGKYLFGAWARPKP